MTMLKTFDLKGNKLSFAEWISNLSPCETPFISMIGKEKVDQTQYSWQTDALAKAVAPTAKEGEVVAFTKPASTMVHTNFTQILRKAVRVSDTTKKVSLYGRGTELGYQLEKAGMEIKRDLETMVLNSTEAGRPGTAAQHGIAEGIQKLVAAKDAADADTGAVVHKVVSYAADAVKFTQVQVFDMTYQLYLVGARANKVMVHPLHMHVFSDWVGSSAVTPHVHRMFDGMDEKYNSHVSTFRDPLGQVFEIIPNRYMPKNQLFFFNEGDWTQMVLREPTKVELAKNGSAEKHMIEMEVGLRHRNPFASAILEFNESAKPFIQNVEVAPSNAKSNNTDTVTVKVFVEGADGVAGSATDSVTVSAAAEDGTVVNVDNGTAAAVAGVMTATIKTDKARRVRVKAAVSGGNAIEMGTAHAVGEFFESRD